MKARVIRWSNTCNKLSDEIAEWSVTSRNPTVALQIAEQVSQVALHLISAQAWGDVFVEFRNNVIGLAKLGKVFRLPTVLAPYDKREGPIADEPRRRAMSERIHELLHRNLQEVF